MALKTSWAGRGEEVLIDRAINQSTYRVGEDTDFQDYREVIERETVMWFGFDEATASAQVDANTQPATGAYSWAMVENERIQYAYDVERVYEKKTTTLVSQTPPPTFGSVSFSPAQNLNVSAWPLSVTISTSTPLSSIMYQINAFNSAGQIVYGPWVEVSGTSAVVSVNTTTIAAGASILGNTYHKAIQINAKAFRELQSGRYESAQSSIYYAQRKPTVSTPTFSPVGSSSVPAAFNFNMPGNVTITSAGSTIISSWRYALSASSWQAPNAGSNASPAVIAIDSPLVYKVVELSAYATVTLDGITYNSSTNKRYYRD